MPHYPAFLVPGEVPPAGTPHEDLRAALSAVSAELQRSGVATVFVTCSSWRTVYFEMGCTPASEPFLRPLVEALKARDIGVSLTPIPEVKGFGELRDALFPGWDVLVVPLSVALKSPEAATQFGIALRETLEHRSVEAAFLASGYLSYSATAQRDGSVMPEGRQFDEKLIEMLEAGAGDQILNLDPRLWFTATPDADLGYLFPLTGFVGSGATGKLMAYRMDPGKGSCIMRFFPPKEEAPGQIIFLEDRSKTQ